MSAAVFLGIFFGLIVYFLPAIIANQRKHSNVGAIFALTIFLGWTLLGWVGAMVWAFSDNIAKEKGEEGKIDASPAYTLPSKPPTNEATEPDTRPCPFCAEDVKRAAIKCKHCGADIQAAT